MPIFKFKNPLRTSGSDGFQTSITDQDGNVSTINVFSIGQDVGTDSNVEFDGVSQPDSQTAIIGTDENNMVLGYGFISGSNLTFTTDEQGISENYTHEDDITINGNINFFSASAEQENTVRIESSGSTKFGDTLDDLHQITGSFNVTGSMSLNGTTISVSDNSDVSLARQDVLVTERVGSIVLGGDTITENEYLRKIYAKKADTISNSTASFAATTASIATGMTTTSIHDFQFFINGMIMEFDALTIQQNPANEFELHINTDSLGYNLQSDDEIVAWGKFNS
jgi:hypothetical protein|tara:strand:- start:434 stop:1279 length:846 start_codon:yes stop_codon:yes gene_type:complete